MNIRTNSLIHTLHQHCDKKDNWGCQVDIVLWLKLTQGCRKQGIKATG